MYFSYFISSIMSTLLTVLFSHLPSTILSFVYILTCLKRWDAFNSEKAYTSSSFSYLFGTKFHKEILLHSQLE